MNMKQLYLECQMGASGDMLASALLDLLPLPDREAVVSELNHLGIDGVRFESEESVRCGIRGIHLNVLVDGKEECEHGHSHDHEHATLQDAEHRIKALNLPETVKQNITAVYQLIAEAESEVHGVPVDEIHFHEVGTLDALADITAVCLLMHRLAPERVIASPVHVGCGQVACTHGILPVPAPATLCLLQGVPVYGGTIQGELCTPTGAALLRYFVDEFGSMPAMNVGTVGYGMGTKELEAANCLRAVLSEEGQPGEDEVCLLCCQVDDMTGEEIGFAMNSLFSAGALDVYTIPIEMKKSRPGVLLHLLCKPEDREMMIGKLFCLTTTIGIREIKAERHRMMRRTETVSTPFGFVRRKISEGYGIERHKYEYDDLADIAERIGMSLRDVTLLLTELERERSERSKQPPESSEQ